jgi:hypothetical protein
MPNFDIAGTPTYRFTQTVYVIQFDINTVHRSIYTVHIHSMYIHTYQNIRNKIYICKKGPLFKSERF